MARFNVTDSAGNTNFIEAEESYVAANYDSYTKVAEVIIDDPIIHREWRDQELKDTDWIAQTPDHPERDDYLAYRVKLRDWPSTSDFPDTKPTAP
jgi:hypothetical protein